MDVNEGDKFGFTALHGAAAQVTKKFVICGSSFFRGT